MAEKTRTFEEIMAEAEAAQKGKEAAVKQQIDPEPDLPDEVPAIAETTHSDRRQETRSFEEIMAEAQGKTLPAVQQNKGALGDAWTAAKIGGRQFVQGPVIRSESEKSLRDMTLDKVVAQLPEPDIAGIESLAGKKVGKMEWREFDRAAQDFYGTYKEEGQWLPRTVWSKKLREMMGYQEGDENEPTGQAAFPMADELIGGSLKSQGVSPVGAGFIPNTQGIYEAVVRPIMYEDDAAAEDAANEMAQSLADLRKEYSDAARAEDELPFLDPEATWNPLTWFSPFDDKTKGIRGIFNATIEQAPMIGGMIVSSRIGGKVGAGYSVRKFGGPLSTMEEIQKLQKVGARVGGAAAGGATEMVLIRDAVFNETQSRLESDQMTQDKWDQNEDYQNFVAAGLMPEEAKQLIGYSYANSAAEMAMVISGALLGTPMGAVYGQTVGRSGARQAAKDSILARMGKNAIGEIAQEMGQESVEQIASNLKVMKVDPEVGPFEGVAEAMAAAAFVSGPYGAIGGIQSDKGAGVAKEYDALIRDSQPWVNAANERWKYQNKKGPNTKFAKDASPQDQVTAMIELERLQEKEANAFLSVRKRVRSLMEKNGASPEALLEHDKRVEGYKKDAAMIAKRRKSRQLAKRQLLEEKRAQAEREEARKQVEREVGLIDENLRLVDEMSAVQKGEILDEAAYEELAKAGYGTWNQRGDTFMLTQRGVRAREELAAQAVDMRNKIESGYSGGERREDKKLREAYQHLTEQEFEEQVMRDPDTNLWNKRKWNQDKNEGKPVAVLDADALKWINDNLSHSAGTQMLRQIANEINSMGGGAEAYRYGGDEFIVTHPDADKLQSIVEKAVSRINQLPRIEEAGKSVKVQVSVGYGADFDSADAALQEEKDRRITSGERADSRVAGATPPSLRVTQAEDSPQMPLFAMSKDFDKFNDDQLNKSTGTYVEEDWDQYVLSGDMYYQSQLFGKQPEVDEEHMGWVEETVEGFLPSTNKGNPPITLVNDYTQLEQISPNQFDEMLSLPFGAQYVRGIFSMDDPSHGVFLFADAIIAEAKRGLKYGMKTVSWNSLKYRIREGDTVEVIDENGKIQTGRVTAFTKKPAPWESRRPYGSFSKGGVEKRLETQAIKTRQKLNKLIRREEALLKQRKKMKPEKRENREHPVNKELVLNFEKQNNLETELRLFQSALIQERQKRWEKPQETAETKAKPKKDDEINSITVELKDGSVLVFDPEANKVIPSAKPKKVTPKSKKAQITIRPGGAYAHQNKGKAFSITGQIQSLSDGSYTATTEAGSTLVFSRTGLLSLTGTEVADGDKEIGAIVEALRERTAQYGGNTTTGAVKLTIPEDKKTIPAVEAAMPKMSRREFIKAAASALGAAYVPMKGVSEEQVFADLYEVFANTGTEGLIALAQERGEGPLNDSITVKRLLREGGDLASYKGVLRPDNMSDESWERAASQAYELLQNERWLKNLLGREELEMPAAPERTEKPMPDFYLGRFKHSGENKWYDNLGNEEAAEDEKLTKDHVQTVVADTVMHETVGHFGIRGLTQDYETYIKLTHEMVDAFPEVVDALRSLGYNYRTDINKGEDLNRANKALLGEEVMAWTAGELLSKPEMKGMTLEQQSVVRRFITWFKEQLIQMGWGKFDRKIRAAQIRAARRRMYNSPSKYYRDKARKELYGNGDQKGLVYVGTSGTRKGKYKKGKQRKPGVVIRSRSGFLNDKDLLNIIARSHDAIVKGHSKWQFKDFQGQNHNLYMRDMEIFRKPIHDVLLNGTREREAEERLTEEDLQPAPPVPTLAEAYEQVTGKAMPEGWRPLTPGDFKDESKRLEAEEQARLEAEGVTGGDLKKAMGMFKRENNPKALFEAATGNMSEEERGLAGKVQSVISQAKKEVQRKENLIRSKKAKIEAGERQYGEAFNQDRIPVFPEVASIQGFLDAARAALPTATSRGSISEMELEAAGFMERLWPSRFGDMASAIANDERLAERLGINAKRVAELKQPGVQMTEKEAASLVEFMKSLNEANDTMAMSELNYTEEQLDVKLMMQNNNLNVGDFVPHMGRYALSQQNPVLTTLNLILGENHPLTESYGKALSDLASADPATREKARNRLLDIQNAPIDVTKVQLPKDWLASRIETPVYEVSVSAPLRVPLDWGIHYQRLYGSPPPGQFNDYSDLPVAQARAIRAEMDKDREQGVDIGYDENLDRWITAETDYETRNYYPSLMPLYNVPHTYRGAVFWQTPANGVTTDHFDYARYRAESDSFGYEGNAGVWGHVRYAENYDADTNAPTAPNPDKQGRALHWHESQADHAQRGAKRYASREQEVEAAKQASEDGRALQAMFNSYLNEYLSELDRAFLDEFQLAMDRIDDDEFQEFLDDVLGPEKGEFLKDEDIELAKQLFVADLYDRDNTVFPFVDDFETALGVARGELDDGLLNYASYNEQPQQDQDDLRRDRVAQASPLKMGFIGDARMFEWNDNRAMNNILGRLLTAGRSRADQVLNWSNRTDFKQNIEKLRTGGYNIYDAYQNGVISKNRLHTSNELGGPDSNNMPGHRIPFMPDLAKRSLSTFLKNFAGLDPLEIERRVNERFDEISKQKVKTVRLDVNDIASRLTDSLGRAIEPSMIWNQIKLFAANPWARQFSARVEYASGTGEASVMGYGTDEMLEAFEADFLPELKKLMRAKTTESNLQEVENKIVQKREQLSQRFSYERDRMSVWRNELNIQAAHLRVSDDPNEPFQHKNDERANGLSVAESLAVMEKYGVESFAEYVKRDWADIWANSTPAEKRSYEEEGGSEDTPTPQWYERYAESWNDSSPGVFTFRVPINFGSDGLPNDYRPMAIVKEKLGSRWRWYEVLDEDTGDYGQALYVFSWSRMTTGFGAYLYDYYGSHYDVDSAAGEVFPDNRSFGITRDASKEIQKELDELEERKKRGVAEDSKKFDAALDGIDAIMQSGEFDDMEAAFLRIIDSHKRSGYQKQHLIEKNEQWRTAQMLWAITEAVRNGYARIHLAPGSESGSRGGYGRTASNSAYFVHSANEAKFELVQKSIRGQKRDIIIMKADTFQDPLWIDITEDRLLPLNPDRNMPDVIENENEGYFSPSLARQVGRDVAEAIATKLRTSGQAASNKTLLISKTKWSGNQQQLLESWLVHDTEGNILEIAASEEEANKVRQKIYDGDKTLGGESTPSGTVTAEDVGGPIQFNKTYYAGSPAYRYDHASPSHYQHTFARPSYEGGRANYDMVLPARMNGYLKRFGLKIEEGWAKVTKTKELDVMYAGGGRITYTVPATVTDQYPNIKIDEITGENYGFIVNSDNGVVIPTVFSSRERAETHLRSWLEAQSTDTDGRVKVMQITLNDEIRKAHSRPQNPFLGVKYQVNSNKQLKSALSKIGAKEPSLLDRFNDWRRTWKASMNISIFDRFYGVLYALNMTGSSSEGYKLMRLTTGLDAIMKGVFEYGHPVWSNGVVTNEGRGLLKILEPVADHVDYWAGYMAGVRAKRLLMEGYEKLGANDKAILDRAAGDYPGADANERLFNLLADATKVDQFAETEESLVGASWNTRKEWVKSRMKSEGLSKMQAEEAFEDQLAKDSLRKTEAQIAEEREPANGLPVNVNTAIKRLINAGRERNFTPADIKELIKFGDDFPSFQQVAEDYADFNKKMLDFAEEAGVINPETRPLWEEADYIPFYRIADDRLVGPLAKTNGVANQNSPAAKHLKGGTQNVGDLVHNIFINATNLMDASIKNNAARNVVDTLVPTGLMRQEKINQPPVDMEDIRRVLARNEMNLDDLEEQVQLGLQTMFSAVPDVGAGVISILRDGKKEYYRTEDELLFRSLAAVNMEAFGAWLNPIMKPARFSKRFLTASITLDPGFMLANYIRDSMSAYVLSRDHFVPMVSGVKGFKEAITEGDTYKAMVASGAAFESGLINQGDPKSTHKYIQSKMKDAGFQKTLLNTPRKMLNAWKRLGSATENANRIAIYQAAKAAGKSDLEALYEAKDIMDFSMSGDSAAIQLLIQTVPFMGARLQGLHRLGRGAAENPKAFFAKGMLIGVAGIALWLRYRDDPRYDELEDWDKDAYFHWWIGDQHFRLPKGFEVGAIFNTLPERIMEAIYSDETDAGKFLMRRLGHMMLETFNMNPIPQIAKPAIEIAANYDFFRKRSIESPYERNMLPEDRHSVYTSETMRALSALFPEGVNTKWYGDIKSPKQLEHAWNGYTGTIGRMLLNISDVGMRHLMDYPVAPDWDLSDLPVLGRIYRGDRPRRTRYEEEFYREANTAVEILGSMNKAKRGEDDPRFDELEEYYGDYVDRAKELESYKREISGINKEIREVRMDPDKNRKQKRKELDELQLDKNEIFKEAYENRPAANKDDKPQSNNIDTLIDNYNSTSPEANEELRVRAPQTSELLAGVNNLSPAQLDRLSKAANYKPREQA